MSRISLFFAIFFVYINLGAQERAASGLLSKSDLDFLAGMTRDVVEASRI
jgi:hypothetical protein